MDRPSMPTSRTGRSRTEKRTWLYVNGRARFGRAGGPKPREFGVERGGPEHGYRGGMYRRPPLSALRWALVLGLAASSSMGVGCTGQGEDEDEDGSEAAVTLSKGQLVPMANAAAALANRLAKTGVDKDTPFAMPLPGEIASKSFGAWKVAFVDDISKQQRGFLLLPQRNAPRGAFGLVLANGEQQIVATAAYVPDAAPHATEVAAAILAALPADANAIASSASIAERSLSRSLICPSGCMPAFGGLSIKPAGVYDKLLAQGAEIALKLLGGARRGAGEAVGVATSAEAHLAPKVGTSTWKAFAALVDDTKIVAQYLSELAAARMSLGGRKVIMVETSEFVGRSGPAGEPILANMTKTLTAHLGARRNQVALAMRGTAEHASVVRWALENDVPVVLGSLDKNASEALTTLSRAVDNHDLHVFLVDAARDPKKLALVRNLNVAKVESSGPAMFDVLDFTPVWAVSDEALALRVGGVDGPFFGWLQRFETATFLGL
jgi:hypothetical protein